MDGRKLKIIGWKRQLQSTRSRKAPIFSVTVASLTGRAEIFYIDGVVNEKPIARHRENGGHIEPGVGRYIPNIMAIPSPKTATGTMQRYAG